MVNTQVNKMAEKGISFNEKIRLFRSLFTGLENVYGTYDPQTGKVRQAKETVTEKVIANHLMGKQSYGVYLLVKDRTQAIAADFDTHDLQIPAQFIKTAQEYNLPAYVERSKSKGYHIWIFFEENGVLAVNARLIVNHILARIGQPNIEVFPKRDSLDNKVSYGNFINAPLFGTSVADGRTVFVDSANGYKPHPNQWGFLAGVEKVNEDKLDSIITYLNLMPAPKTVPEQPTDSDNRTYFSLPHCARRILAEGVDSYQRLACFRLAVSLKRVGLPFDVAVAALKAWSLKNKPQSDKRIITEAEITSQTKSAYKNDYRSYGCESPAITQYCDHQCPIYKNGNVNYGGNCHG